MNLSPSSRMPASLDRPRLQRALAILGVLSVILGGVLPAQAAGPRRRLINQEAAPTLPAPAPPTAENRRAFEQLERQKQAELDQAQKALEQGRREVQMLRQKPHGGKAGAPVRREINAAINRELALSRNVDRLKLELENLRRRSAAPAGR